MLGSIASSGEQRDDKDRRRGKKEREEEVQRKGVKMEGKRKEGEERNREIRKQCVKSWHRVYEWIILGNTIDLRIVRTAKNHQKNQTKTKQSNSQLKNIRI